MGRMTCILQDIKTTLQNTKRPDQVLCIIHGMYSPLKNKNIINLDCLTSLECGLNSLAPGRFQFHFSRLFRLVIFKLTLKNGGWGISHEIALRWMSLDLTDDKSTLVQVMARCRQATSHYLSQCWPRSLLPYGVTRPQWVKFFKKIFKSILRLESFDIFIKISPRCYLFIVFSQMRVQHSPASSFLVQTAWKKSRSFFIWWKCMWVCSHWTIGFGDYTDLLWWK